MILRNKRISKTADEIMLRVSYGLPDVKRMMQQIFCHYHYNCEWLYQEQLATPRSEQDLLDILESDPQCFANYGEKWARPLAEWAFCAALREGYIIQSANHEYLYYFTEKCIKKKRGRPVKSE